MHRIAIVLLASLSLLVGAAGLPYDEGADAKATVKSAQAAASEAGLPLLIIFGANWCEDCRALDQALGSERNASLVAKHFKVVKVDVGRFDRNLDVVAAYGEPIKKGIPAAVVVAPDQRIVYSTKAGELADARRMGEAGIYDFFVNVSKSTAVR